MISCKSCILDLTDACTRGAGRAVDDEICDNYISENDCLTCLFSTRKDKLAEAYQQGRADLIDRLKDDYANCEGSGKCNNCMFSRYGKIKCVFEEQNNEKR